MNRLVARLPSSLAGAVAALPAPWRAPLLILGAAVPLALLAVGARGWGARATRPRDAAADALFRRLTAVDVLGAPACPAGASCAELVRYAPAPLEAEWAARGQDFAGRECAQIVSEHALWQAQLEGVVSTGGAGAGALGAGGTWSVMTYRDAATGAEASVALEPLAGVMRDPRPVCAALELRPREAARGLDSRDFTLLDPAFYRGVAAQLFAPAHAAAAPAPPMGPEGRPRALLFDLGATRWDPKHVTGMRWTVETYEGLGISFDAIFAWEATPIATTDFFGTMPLRLAARTHLFNVPVARPGTGGVADALAMLREVARPQDFVVFKLDIDTEVLEEEIAMALLADDALATRVDDFYFEHHSNTHGVMDQFWGTNAVRSLQESILLFSAFRRRGIRAHSWP